MFTKVPLLMPELAGCPITRFRVFPGSACEQVASIIRRPSNLSYRQLKLLPFWDAFRGDPRFEQIVASLPPK
jgi:hypothetical protein